MGVEPGLKNWSCHCLPSFYQVSDLRNQVYPENGLDPFPGEGRVVGWQRIRKPVTMEHPGELGPEAAPGGGGAVQDKGRVAASTVTHSPSPTKGSQCPPYRF